VQPGKCQHAKERKPGKCQHAKERRYRYKESALHSSAAVATRHRLAALFPPERRGTGIITCITHSTTTTTTTAIARAASAAIADDKETAGRMDPDEWSTLGLLLLLTIYRERYR